ncbi:hypothetical protein AB0I28_22595 [Phytomonospora sp. NPDC050363]|uniref:hypothetical protein n=1 Tax=Phytomonospora sp. NPDC050363 TaxID=3155642 RepID=UPI00340AEDDD
MLIREVGRQIRADTAAVFVNPGGFPNARVELAAGNLVVMRGRSGWGTGSAAIELLKDRTEIYELPPNLSPSVLPVDRMPRGAGFILKGLDRPHTASLRGRDLRELETRLSEREAKLVLVLESGTRPRDHAAESMVVDLLTPPCSSTVVERHLIRLLGTAGDVCELLDGCRGVFDRIEDETFDIHLLVELARDLADVARGRITATQACDNFADRRGQDLEDWFESITDLEQCSLVHAVAVFGGLPFEDIVQAAESLLGALRRRLADKPEAHYPARASRTRRLRAVKARTRWIEQRSRYGTGEIEVVEFIDDTYPVRILEQLARLYPEDLDAVLDWLHAMAEESKVQINIRACVAIGYLARFAFERVRKEILQPWARSGRVDKREFVIAALAVLADHPPTTGPTVRLVGDWSRRSGPLQITGARALGSAVGSAMPDRAERELARLADGADPQLAAAVGRSLRELFELAGPMRRAALLQLLTQWLHESTSGRTRAAMAAFLEMATMSTTASTPLSQAKVPLLLALAVPTEDDEAAVRTARSIRDAVSELWGAALIAPGVDAAVARVLRTWATTAEFHPEYRPVLVGLLTLAADTPRKKRLLGYHVRAWRDKRSPTPFIASRLLTALNPESTGT